MYVLNKLALRDIAVMSWWQWCTSYSFFKVVILCCCNHKPCLRFLASGFLRLKKQIVAGIENALICRAWTCLDQSILHHQSSSQNPWLRSSYFLCITMTSWLACFVFVVAGCIARACSKWLYWWTHCERQAQREIQFRGWHRTQKQASQWQGQCSCTKSLVVPSMSFCFSSRACVLFRVQLH